MQPDRSLSGWIWNCPHIDAITKGTIMPRVRDKEETIATLKAALAIAMNENHRLTKIIEHYEEIEPCCELCDKKAEYRQCQQCMNATLVGSYTDK